MNKARRRRVMAGGVAVILLLPAVGAIVWLWHFPVGGSLYLGTAVGENDAELYVGDRFVGIGEAEVSWSDILGWNGKAPLGVVLPTDVKPPAQNPTRPTFLVEATAERLAGSDAEIIKTEAGSPVWLRHGWHEASFGEITLRRGDGQLDHVFCVDASLAAFSGKKYRVLVPVRVRHPTDRGAIFTTEQRGSALGRFANFLHRFSTDWNFERSESPAELAFELKNDGLWRPEATLSHRKGGSRS